MIKKDISDVMQSQRAAIEKYREINSQLHYSQLDKGSLYILESQNTELLHKYENQTKSFNRFKIRAKKKIFNARGYITYLKKQIFLCKKKVLISPAKPIVLERSCQVDLVSQENCRLRREIEYLRPIRKAQKERIICNSFIKRENYLNIQHTASLTLFCRKNEPFETENNNLSIQSSRSRIEFIKPISTSTKLI